MGFVNKNFTLVTSLTQKGREYFLSKNKNKFNIKFFALSDSDTNYIVASSNTSPFVYNTLKLGYIPNLSGYNDSTIDCLRYIANGIAQKYSVGGNDGDCTIISEHINPFTNELSCTKVDYPIIYPFTSTLNVDMINSNGVLFPTGKDSFGNNIILFNEKDNSVDDFSFDVFLGLRNNVSVNDNYEPYGLESYSFLLNNLNNNIISIDNEQSLNINNNLPNLYRFEKNQTNVVDSFNFKVNKNYYNTLNNYGLNDLIYVDYFKSDFIDGIIETLPSTIEVPLDKKSYIVKAYKATTVSIDNDNVIDLGDIKQYVTSGVGSINIDDIKLLLNSKSPNGLESFDINISSNNNYVSNLRFDNNDKNNLRLKYAVGEDIININNNDIKFGFDETTIPSGSKIDINLQLKLTNPNKFVYVDQLLNSKIFKLSYNKKRGVYFGGNITKYTTNFKPNEFVTLNLIELSDLNIYVESTNIFNDDIDVLIDVSLVQNSNTPILASNLRIFTDYELPTSNDYKNNKTADMPTLLSNRSYSVGSYYQKIIKGNLISDNKLNSNSTKTIITTNDSQRIGITEKNKQPLNINPTLNAVSVSSLLLENFDGYIDTNATYNSNSGFDFEKKPDLTTRPAFMFDFNYPSDEILLEFNNKIPFDIVYTIKPSDDYEILGNDKIIITVNPIIKQPKFLSISISSNGGVIPIGIIDTSSGLKGTQSNQGGSGSGGQLINNSIGGKDIKTINLSTKLTLNPVISGNNSIGTVVVYINNIKVLDYDSNNPTKKFNLNFNANEGDVLNIEWSGTNYSTTNNGGFSYTLSYLKPNPLYIPV